MQNIRHRLHVSVSDYFPAFSGPLRGRMEDISEKHQVACGQEPETGVQPMEKFMKRITNASATWGCLYLNPAVI